MKISRNVFLICCCLSCILFTLLARSSVYDITNPKWYQSSIQQNSDKTKGQEITIHFHERRPYQTGYKGEARGVVATPISQAFNYADIPFKWQETPAARQLEIIRQNESRSCAAGWFKTDEREQYGRFSKPIYQDNPIVAITRADNDLVSSIETVEHVFKERRLVLLIKDSYSYGNYLDSRFKELSPRTITTTASNQAMLMMIHSYRADYCFMTEEEAKDHLIYSGLTADDFKLIKFADIPKGNMRYLVCSQKVEEEVMNKLNRAITYLVNLEEVPNDR